jgi:hypothetical protein
LKILISLFEGYIENRGSSFLSDPNNLAPKLASVLANLDVPMLQVCASSESFVAVYKTIAEVNGTPVQVISKQSSSSSVYGYNFSSESFVVDSSSQTLLFSGISSIDL